MIGAIFNAASEEVLKHKTDAITFLAIDNVEQRMRIYNSLVRKFSAGFSSHRDNVKIQNGLMTIVFNKTFPDKAIQDFEEFLKKQEK